MFNIILYEFNKKINSTKKVNVSGTSFQCTIKDIDSILTPIVELDPTAKLGKGEIPLFNYAYIPAFKRYYFIDDIAYNLGTWSLSMHCDTLATYRDDILMSNQYVLRSASVSNPYIIDNMYMNYVEGSASEHDTGTMSTNVQRYNTSSSTWEAVNYFNRTIGQGEIVIGVLGGSAYGVTYYAMPVGSFQEFLQEAFALVPSDMTDVSPGVAGALYDPIQYITYCKWFPMKPLPQNIGSTMVHTIQLGPYNVTFPSVDSSCFKFEGLGTEKYRCNIYKPAHPQATDYPYLELEPFSEYSLLFQPFGNIPLDTTKILGSDRIRAVWTIDYCTGQAMLELYSGVSFDGLFYSNMSEIGVTLPVSTLVMDWKSGLAVSALTYLKSTPVAKASNWLTSLFNTNPVETDSTGHRMRKANVSPGNTPLLDTLQDVIGSSLGNVATTGTAGSFLSYNYREPIINGWFRKQAEHEKSRFGQPVCMVLSLSGLSGFTVCANAQVQYNTLNPTADEQNAVIEALNTGVYIE